MRLTQKKIPIYRQLILSLCFLVSLHLSSQLHAKEELTVIQTVSNNQRSLIISKGMKDGVFKGQEIIFANDNVSIVCRAIEVNRDFSMWVPLDMNVTLPFNKNDIISINSTVYGNVALEVAGDSGLVPDLTIKERMDVVNNPTSFTLKASLSKGLAQSSSSVVDEKNTGRSGNNFSFDYNYKFIPEFEMSLGLRIDSEIYRIEDPQLDIPTRRTMALLATTYHFVNYSASLKNNFYVTLAAGIGRSTTTIDNEDVVGRVLILPEARIGYLLKISPAFSMVFESGIESVSTSETFLDGTNQTTNSLTIRGSVGVRF